ncbi:hypothetical protein CEXT_482041 [Caerostris extrusa]|uniref:Uncharacterized protein n=1 Tax=Caerostris extrusa TaxID=172846 RepID=A0AAV4YDJ7_CAEEX|nr:hypothetical protein CEXT_482041 [Caerostris extrusa]
MQTINYLLSTGMCTHPLFIRAFRKRNKHSIPVLSLEWKITPEHIRKSLTTGIITPCRAHRHAADFITALLPRAEKAGLCVFFFCFSRVMSLC